MLKINDFKKEKKQKKNGMKESEIRECIQLIKLNLKKQQNYTKLMNQYKDLIKNNVSKFIVMYPDAKQFEEDLIQQGYIGLFDAVEKFELDRTYTGSDGYQSYPKFITCAYWWINLRIKDYYTKNCRMLKIGEAILKDRRLVMIAMGELEIETDSLTSNEIELVAAKTGLTPERVNEVYNICYSMLRAVDGDDVLDTLEAKESSVVDSLKAYDIMIRLYNKMQYSPMTLDDIYYSSFMAKLLYSFIKPDSSSKESPDGYTSTKCGQYYQRLDSYDVYVRRLGYHAKKYNMNLDDLKAWILTNKELFEDALGFIGIE
jgi:DNA-directed RNA polymerase specialized sigma subunit